MAGVAADGFGLLGAGWLAAPAMWALLKTIGISVVLSVVNMVSLGSRRNAVIGDASSRRRSAP